jgi:biopolymer transport protein ExbD
MAGDEYREPLLLGGESPEDAEVLQRILNKPKRKPPEPLKMNMTPMIDIVFQLIIFFMIVSEFQNMEMEQITLPFALEAKEESKDGQQNRVVVNVNDKGEIRMMRRQYSSEQLKALLIERARNSPKDADGLPTIAVKLRADAECEYKFVQDVIVQCMRAYIWKLSFGASHIDREELMLY